jgi:hypothetical protein
MIAQHNVSTNEMKDIKINDERSEEIILTFYLIIKMINKTELIFI